MTHSNGRPTISKFSQQIDHVQTNTYVAGQGNPETIVMLHGMSASADTFRDLMLELSSDYQIVAPDIPGFGDSGDTNPYTFPRLVAWLDDFLAELDTSPVHIVGHSFGGALAVSYALEKPADVRTLILFAPSVLRPGKFPEWLRGLARSRVSEWVLGLGVSASRVRLQSQMRAAFYNPSRFGPELWERRKHDYMRARASAAVLRASALHDIRADLHKITQRSCIIWGENDPVLEPADAQALNELMPKSSTDLYLLANCGHIPHIEQQERVVSIIHDFLSSDE